MIDLPGPVRILAALEYRPHTWIRTGPWSIAHADLRVRLTLGVNVVLIERIGPGGYRVTIVTPSIDRSWPGRIQDNRSALDATAAPAPAGP